MNAIVCKLNDHSTEKTLCKNSIDSYFNEIRPIEKIANNFSLNRTGRNRPICPGLD